MLMCTYRAHTWHKALRRWRVVQCQTLAAQVNGFLGLSGDADVLQLAMHEHKSHPAPYNASRVLSAQTVHSTRAAIKPRPHTLRTHSLRGAHPGRVCRHQHLPALAPQLAQHLIKHLHLARPTDQRRQVLSISCHCCRSCSCRRCLRCRHRCCWRCNSCCRGCWSGTNSAGCNTPIRGAAAAAGCGLLRLRRLRRQLQRLWALGLEVRQQEGVLAHLFEVVAHQAQLRTSSASQPVGCDEDVVVMRDNKEANKECNQRL